jgi:hypothetical protein
MGAYGAIVPPAPNLQALTPFLCCLLQFIRFSRGQELWWHGLKAKKLDLGLWSITFPMRY